MTNVKLYLYKTFMTQFNLIKIGKEKKITPMKLYI